MQREMLTRWSRPRIPMVGRRRGAKEKGKRAGVPPETDTALEEKVRGYDHDSSYHGIESRERDSKRVRIDGSQIRRVITRSPNYLKDYEDDDAAFNEAARNKKRIRRVKDFSLTTWTR